MEQQPSLHGTHPLQWWCSPLPPFFFMAAAPLRGGCPCPCSSPSSALHGRQPWQPPCCCVMAGGGGRRRLHEAMTGPRDDDRASDVVPPTRCSWWTT
uniref:Uncharacterized protein n=1 Tax=Zea mays TaxID=4577 RepID=B6TVX7_MAIZE|nr:hypothetical protein [Zea mays]